LLGAAVGQPQVERCGQLPDAALAVHGAVLPGPERRRADHFFGERARVRAGAAAWAAGDVEQFGALMNASCRSSIECWEVGSPETVRLHELLRDCPGVLGSRFSGAGFGGCVVALVAADAADACVVQIEAAYAAAEPELAARAAYFLVESEDGLRVV
jgi:galactokinase